MPNANSGNRHKSCGGYFFNACTSQYEVGPEDAGHGRDNDGIHTTCTRQDTKHDKYIMLIGQKRYSVTVKIIIFATLN